MNKGSKRYLSLTSPKSHGLPCHNKQFFWPFGGSPWAEDVFVLEELCKELCKESLHPGILSELSVALWEEFDFVFRFTLVCMYECFTCMCIYTTQVYLVCREVRRRRWITRVTEGCGNGPRSSARAASILSHWTTLPAPRWPCYHFNEQHIGRESQQDCLMQGFLA